MRLVALYKCAEPLPYQSCIFVCCVLLCGFSDFKAVAGIFVWSSLQFRIGVITVREYFTDLRVVFPLQNSEIGKRIAFNQSAYGECLIVITCFFAKRCNCGCLSYLADLFASSKIYDVGTFVLFSVAVSTTPPFTYCCAFRISVPKTNTLCVRIGKILAASGRYQ